MKVAVKTPSVVWVIRLVRNEASTLGELTAGQLQHHDGDRKDQASDGDHCRGDRAQEASCAVRAALEYEWQMLGEFPVDDRQHETQSERTQADRQGKYPERPPHPRPPGLGLDRWDLTAGPAVGELLAVHVKSLSGLAD